MLKPLEVSITFDVETAAILLEVLRHVSGSPEGPRGAMDRLAEKLEHVCSPDEDFIHAENLIRGFVVRGYVDVSMASQLREWR